MKRSRKVLIVCHCLLNANAKIYPLALTGGVYRDVLEAYIRDGTGLFQLPCPELSYLGVNRWGMTREQYDHPNFRSHCKEILKHPLNQIEALLHANYEITGVLGMDGSPNCGVHLTSDGFTGGEICSQNDIASQIDGLRFVYGKGIFMGILAEMLQSKNIFTEFFAVSEKENKGHNNNNQSKKGDEQ
jgi:predicted secreted protein